MDEYRGLEIISDLVYNKQGVPGQGKIKKTQRILVRCSNCCLEQPVVYDGHVRNRLKSINDPYRCRKCMAKTNITNFNKTLKGVKLEERVGKERANSIKSKLRQYAIDNNIGSRLSNFSGVSWDDRYGIEKSNILKEQFRKNHKLPILIGESNYQWGKPAHKLSGSGVKGYYDGIFFRSLMEASFIINVLEKNNLKFENGELKKYAIPYFYDGRLRNYFCDFVVDGTFYEVKPKALFNCFQNKAKWESAEKWCRDNDKTFKIYCEEDFDQLDTERIDFLKESGKLILI